MKIFGLHILDASIIAFFLIAIIVISVVVSRSVKGESDFFLGGRKLGRWLQFFLNFGNMTDSSGAVVISSEVYRQGVGGIWIGFQTLFITPFYWFSAVWYRRVRLITMADIFVDRFRSKGLASAYAVFNIFIALILLGMGNVVTYKVAAAMVVKPAAEWTVEERQSVELYKEFRELKAQVEARTISDSDREKFRKLDSREKRGELKSFVSYVEPIPFYLAYTFFIILYIVLGGLRAAAICDALQGVLILVMSVLLIPVGLLSLGGFSKLHEQVPEYMFELFGTVAMSEYTLYSIAAIAFTSLIQMFGLMHQITVAGSASDETAARIGAVSGGFTKRFVLIAWSFCGLIAIAVFAQSGIADPDNAWGALSLQLLPAGLMGLMLAGMLLGHMPAVGASAVSVSALVTRNIYEPLVRGKSEKHYLRIGQSMIVVVLLLAIIIALFFQGAVEMMVMLITFNVYFGAVILLVFFWRRITAAAVKIGFVVWIVLLGLVPYTLEHFEGARRSEALLLQTAARDVQVTAGATQEDVTAGRATVVGQSIRKPHVIPPRGVFFDKVARVDPEDPKSALEGLGRFHVEAYALSLFGVPVERFSPAGLVTTRWLFDGLFPFLMLFVFSLFTRQADPELVRRFYVKMKTPVRQDPEADAREMELSYADPERFDHEKIFPGSNWEFCKWNKRDLVGFLVCWGIVVAILLLLVTLLEIGA